MAGSRLGGCGTGLGCLGMGMLEHLDFSFHFHRRLPPPNQLSESRRRRFGFKLPKKPLEVSELRSIRMPELFIKKVGATVVWENLA